MRCFRTVDSNHRGGNAGRQVSVTVRQIAVRITLSIVRENTRFCCLARKSIRGRSEVNG
jgi:hypothetical protein